MNQKNKAELMSKDVGGQRKIFVRPVLLSVFTGLVLAGIFSAVFTAFAVPPTSKYDAGATLDPNCSAGDTNCGVVAPAQYSFSSNDFSGTGGFTTTGSITGNRLGVDIAPLSRTGIYMNPTFTDADAVYGIQDYATVNASAPSYKGLNVGVTAGSGYTITDNYGVYIQNPLGSGSITTNYGLYIENQTKGGTDYAIYSVGGDNYFGGNVGIGTTAPDRPLEINSSDGNAFRLTFDDADGSALNYVDFSTTSAGNLAISPSGGWVGIGTTTPTRILHVYENTTNIDVVGVAIDQAGTGDSKLKFSLSGGQQWSTGIDNDDSDSYKISANGVLGTSDVITLLTGGNVGIGTNSPESILHTSGGYATFEDTNKIYLTPNYAGLGDIPAGTVISSASTNLSFLPSSDGGVGDTLGMYAYTGSAWKSMVETANATGGADPNLLLAKSGGWVGIGTDSPDTILHLKDGGVELRFEEGTAGDTVDLRANDQGAFVIEQNKDSVNADIYIRPTMTGQSNTKDLIIADEGGSVGIGTTVPDRLLELNTGAATGGIRLTYNDSNGSATTYSDILINSNGDITFSATGGDFSFSDDNITTTGIGTFGNQIKVLEGGASPTYYTIFQGGDQTGADITYILPTSSATGLLKNTSGTLSWDTTAYTANTRNINTTSPLSGGGDLSSDRTLTVGGLSSLGTANYVVGVNSGASAWEYKNIVGTASEIDITHAEGSITIGLVDPLALSKGGTAKSLTASNGGIVYTDSDSMEVLSGTATANQVLLSGSSAAPSWSTATYPATTTANQLLYSSSNNVIAGLSSANYGILNTGTTGVPSITASPTISTSLTIGVAGTATGQLKLSGTTSGTVTLTPAAEAGTWTLTLPTNDGNVNQFLQTNGSGVTTWATDTGFANPMTTIGDIIYGGASGTPTRLGTGTTGKILQANTGAAPSWSTATYPSTTTANQILYSTSNNVVGAGSNLTYSGTLLTVSGSGNGGYINITDEANGYQIDGLRVVSYKGSDGTENLFLGQSGNFTLSGTKNILAGYQAGQALTSGYGNQFIGYQAGYSTTTGSDDVFLGEQAGYSNTTGVANVFLGFQAGYYETGSNKLFIDNQKRTDEADARTKALIYGVFDSAVANQTLTVNGNTDFSSGFTTLNYGTDAPTLGTNGQLSVAYVGSSNRLYWYSNGGVHYVNATAGFEIPAHETIDPLSGDKIQIGDFVLGMVNANIGDKESANKSSLHGIWVKWDSLKTELINEIKNGIGLVPDGSWATGSPLDATAGLQGVDTSTMMERVTNTLTSLGISIKNGVTNIKQLAVEKLTAQTVRIQRLEMVDSATGEIYCTWIENGNWQKAEGDCASVKNTSAVVQTQQPQASTDEIKQAVKKEVKQEVKEELKPEIKGQVKSQIAEAEQQRAEEQQEEQQAASEVGPIVSFVSSIEDISVDFGTEISSIALPASITATVSGADQELLINWNNGTPEYDPNTPETYQFSGTLGNLPDNVTNPDGLEASVNVIVGPAPEPAAQEEQPPAEQPTEDEVESVSDQESTSEKESKGKSQKSTENQENPIEGTTAALTAPIKKVVQESITGFISSISSFAKWSFNTSSSNLNSWAKAYESLFGRLQESSLKVADTIQGAVASLLSSTSEFAKWLFNISVSGLSNGFQDTSESIKEGLDKTPLLMETQTASVSKSFQNIWFLSKESINKLISLFGN